MFAALGNHLWQSTLFAFAAALLTLAFRNNSARVRHCLWLAASLKFLVPFSLLMLLGNRFAAHTSHLGAVSASAAPQWPFLMERIAQPLSSTAQSVSSAGAAPLPATSFSTLASVAIGIWVCGLAVVLWVLLLRWLRIRAALRAAQPFGGPLQPGFPIAVKLSTTTMEPGVIGILRPVLLLPLGISERLRPEQLHAILAHELCHVRRRDNLTGALHLVVEAVFWFHPLVWWIGARIVEERELACDEAVLEGGSDPTVYAEGLLDVCAFYLASPLICAAGVSGASLKTRILAIVRSQGADKLHVAKKALLTAVALLTVATPIVVGVFRVPEARAQAPVAAPQSPDSVSAIITAGSPDSLQKTLLINLKGKFTMHNLSLKSLISFAYNLQETQIAGPADELSRLYNMDAQMAAAPTPGHVEDDFSAMIQGVLADRFKLASHWETRRVPAYALQGGVNSGIKQADAGDPGPLIQLGMNSVSIQGAPFGLFVKYLATQLNRPLLDQTGLAARYNFTLKWGPEAGEPGAPATAGGSPPKPSMALLVDTLQKQLGIQVVSQDGDVRYLVIDHISPPSNLIAAPKEVTIEPAVFDRYVGHYAFVGNMIMTISRDGTRFLTQLTGQPEVQIFATSAREYFAKQVDARITFVTNDDGEATELVLHQNGQDFTMPRMSEAAAKAQAEAVAQRVLAQKPNAGSEAALRKHIEALQHDQPDYDDMEPALAAAIRPQWSAARQQIGNAGPLQSITFTRVSSTGADIYQVQFEKHVFEMHISLDSAGKMGGLFLKRVPAS